jgi:undecaprenyl-diphosphatase
MVREPVHKKWPLLYLALVVVLFTFCLLAVLASRGEFFLWDYWAREEFRRSQFPQLYPWMRLWTRLAEGSFITPFFLIGFGLLWWQRQIFRAFFFLFYTIIFSPLPTLLKLLIARPRPQVVMSEYAVSGYGFPSGHSFAAMAFYGFLAYLLSKHLPHRIARWICCAFCILAILGVGISRVYLHKHWVSDVLGGYLGGGVYLLAALCLLKYYERKTVNAQKALPVTE